MRIGNYTAHAIEMGTFSLDGGAMFGVVPKVLWEKENPADEKNRIHMHTRCLLLRDEKNHRNILIDCGLGDKDDARFKDRFKISSYGMEAELARHGLKPEHITDIIGTHLHFDHLGGLTKFDSDGKLTARFPNAKLWIQERNWRHAWNPNEKDRASYLKENFEIYQGDSRLNLLRGPEEIYPGIRTWLSEGHTLGMQIPFISDGTTSILYTADIVPMSAHVRTAWVMAYDCFPLQSIEEKKTLLKECEEKNTVVFFEHCPWMHGARVKHDGRDFQVVEKVKLS